MPQTPTEDEPWHGHLLPKRKHRPRSARGRTRVTFAGVPQGATGTIIGADRVIDGYDVEVAWGQSERRTPWVDWLTKEEYEAYLIEMP
jgi:hypothetical protein